MYAEFRQERDLECENFTVQESSLATERCVWIGYGDKRAHLNVEEATLVRDALNEFIQLADQALRDVEE